MTDSTVVVKRSDLLRISGTSKLVPLYIYDLLPLLSSLNSGVFKIRRIISLNATDPVEESNPKLTSLSFKLHSKFGFTRFLLYIKKTNAHFQLIIRTHSENNFVMLKRVF